MNNFLRNIIDDNKKHTDNIELFYYESEDTPIEFKNNHLFSLDKKYKTGIGVRVIHRGKLGLSSTNDAGKINETINVAKESSIYGEKVEFNFPQEDKNYFIKEDLCIYDKEFENPDNQKYINSIFDGIKKITKLDNSIKCDASLKLNKFKITVINSNGLCKEYKKTLMFSDITALLLEKDGGFQWINDCNYSTHKICSAEKITDSIIEQIEYSKNVVTLKTEKLPVIFMPLSTNIFFRSLQLASNGKFLQKGISPLTGRDGKKVLNEKITITDDPLLKSMNGTIPFDCEGTTCCKNIIFKEGVFKNFIFDLETASRLNKKTTGNASRTYSRKPTPDFTNFIVKNGKIKISEMIKCLNKGVIIYDLIGAGQSNLLSGDYSVNIGLGFYIENGKIKGRIKNAMIAGNIYEDMLNNIDDISYDTRTFLGYTFPAILFKEKKIVA